MLKRLFIPPLVPVVLLVLALAWVIVDETRSDPTLIEGRPDNAPRNAALMLLLFCPVVYLFFGILNLIDMTLDRLRTSLAWCGSIGICGLLAAILSKVFHAPTVDESPFPGVGIAILSALLSVLPMTLLRRSMLPQRKEAPTIRPQDAKAFDAIFPNGDEAPKIKKADPATPPT